MNEIIYIIGVACFTVQLINAQPFIKLLEWLGLYKYELFKCALCFGSWLGFVMTLVYGLNILYVPIIAILASFIDKYLYE